MVAQGEAAREGLHQEADKLQRSTEPLYHQLAELEARVAKLGWELAAANTCIGDLKVRGLAVSA
jgi:hypothetical protein